MSADSGAEHLSAVMITSAHPLGTVVDVDAPHLLLTDRAATRGDGVFESLLFRRGVLRARGEHLARLRGSAAAMGLAMPDDAAWDSAIILALRAAGAGDAAGAANGATAAAATELNVKLVLTRGPEGATEPTAWVLVTPVRRGEPRGPGNGLSVMTLDRGYPAGIAQRAPWLLIGVKTLSYAVNLAAQRWAKEHGAEDAIFVSTDAVVLEGATSSVVLAHRGPDGGVTLLTPQNEDGLLAGTTQAAAFRAAESLGWTVRSARIGVEDLFTADALWLLSSVRLAAAVTELDGRRIPCDEELHRALAEALDREL